MNIFGRILFFAIAAIMLVSELVLYFGLYTIDSPGPMFGVLVYCWTGSPVAMLLWCAFFLKKESTLARIGIVSVIVLIAAVFWLPHHPK